MPRRFEMLQNCAKKGDGKKACGRKKPSRALRSRHDLENDATETRHGNEDPFSLPIAAREVKWISPHALSDSITR